jgi:hypothetical protein
MDITYDNYFIKYYGDSLDVRITVYNRSNGKKYGLADSDTVTKYKDLGIDINKCITQCVVDKTYDLIDKDTHICLLFNYKDVIQFKLICEAISCEPKEISMLEMRLIIKKQAEEIELLKTRISELEKFAPDYVELYGNKIHRKTKELYLYTYPKNKKVFGGNEAHLMYLPDGPIKYFGLDLSNPYDTRGQNTKWPRRYVGWENSKWYDILHPKHSDKLPHPHYYNG